jgi:hypothetical protein
MNRSAFGRSIVGAGPACVAWSGVIVCSTRPS